MIGGFTTYDLHANALSQIMAEWKNNSSFETRVSNIFSGNGLLTSSGVKLEGNVFADNDKDILTGSGGREWFFSDLNDKLTDFNDDVRRGDLNYHV